MQRKLLEIIRKSRFATWCDKTAFVMLSAQISSMVLFTNGNAAPIAGANSSCLPNWILISRSAKNGNAVIFCFRNFKSASVKYGTRNPLRITSLSMTVLTFRIAAAKWERYAFQIALLLGSQVRTDWKNAAKEFPEWPMHCPNFYWAVKQRHRKIAVDSRFLQKQPLWSHVR